MKKTKRLLSILLVVMMVLLPTPINASAETHTGACGDNLTWSYNTSNRTLTISGIGTMFDYTATPCPWESHKHTIKEVVIKDGATSIGKSAFKDCENLTSVTIPDSVVSIGSYSFYNCLDLQTIILPENLSSIAPGIFNKCISLTSITIPDSVTSIGDHAFDTCFNLITVMLGNSVTSIGDYAFRSCDKLTSISLPNTLQSIGTRAFEHCTSLANIIVPDSVTSIGYYAFFDTAYYYNQNNWENNALYIGSHLIDTNSSISGDFQIEEGTLTIGDHAFSYCKNLTSVTIPNSATSIGISAFEGCTNLTIVYYAGMKEQWNEISVGSNNSCLTNATIYYNSTGPGSDNTNCNGYGHLYNATVTPPTCVQQGYTTYTCTLCGDNYIADYASATGHTMNGCSCSICDYKTLVASEIYSFNNSDIYFNTGTYTILPPHFKTLCNYVEANYTSADEANTTINLLQEQRNQNWGGSCFGMSATVLLDKIGYISFNENFGSGSKTMHDVTISDDVMSVINYYHLSQYVPFVDEYEVCFNKYSSDWSKGLKNVVNTAKTGKLFIFQYFWRNLFEIYGHAIIVTGYKETDDDYNLSAYDCRYPDEPVTINIDKNFKDCSVIYDYNGKKVEENAFRAGYVTDFSGLDKVDIDGPDNQVNCFIASNTSSAFNTTIFFPAHSDITIKNENGDALTYSNGVISGTMDVLAEKMIANSTTYGEADVATMMVEVAEGKAFEAVSSTDDIDISFLTRKTFASATATNSDCVVFDENEGVCIFGENMEYDISLTSNTGNTDMVSISGESVSDVSLVYEDEGIVANGVDGATCQVTIFSDTVNVEDKSFISGYSSVMIAPLSEECGDIDILASSNDDGVYDVSAMVNAEVSLSIQQPSRTEIRYKDGIVLHATLEGNVPEGCKVTWSKSNSNFKALQSADGLSSEIISQNKGYTFFTVSLYDANGNILVSDSIEMYSKAGFFDKIGGFFRSLFGITKIYDK